MAVVAEYVVHAFAVDTVCFHHGVVPSLPLGRVYVQLEILVGAAKCEIILTNRVRTCEVVNHTVRRADTGVPDTWQYPGETRQMSPRDTVRKPGILYIHGWNFLRFNVELILLYGLVLCIHLFSLLNY